MGWLVNYLGLSEAKPMRYEETIEARLTGRHKMAMRLIGDVKNKTILNIGCWIGWFEKFAIENGCRLVIGTDIDLVSLEKANKLAGNADFVLASSTYLPFKNTCFDAIAMFDVVEHVPKGTENDCLREANRVLKKESVFVLSTPNDNFIANLLDPAWYFGHRHYKASEIKHFLEESGFQVEGIEHGGSFVELISMIFLYLFKIFGMEIPFKKYSDRLRDKEYSADGRLKFVTIFVKAWKL